MKEALRMSFTDNEILTAMFYWTLPKATFNADMKLDQGQAISLKEARTASLRSSAFMASKLGISPPAYTKLEASEQSGSITIESLRKAAAALDCELVYTIRPRDEARFREAIWQCCLEYASRYPMHLPVHFETRRGRALATRANGALENPKVRKTNQWMRQSFKRVTTSEQTENAKSAMKRLDRLRRSPDR